MGLNPGNDPYRGHISSTRIRLCPLPKTCTIRPARIVSANQSAARPNSARWRPTPSTNSWHFAKYASVGLIDAASKNAALGRDKRHFGGDRKEAIRTEEGGVCVFVD